MVRLEKALWEIQDSIEAQLRIWRSTSQFFNLCYGENIINSLTFDEGEDEEDYVIIRLNHSGSRCSSQ
jgi:hypothetical protein